MAGSVTFGANQLCDSNWQYPVNTTSTINGYTTTVGYGNTGCYGMGSPWGNSTITNYTASYTDKYNTVFPVVKGYVRAWKWLADL